MNLSVLLCLVFLFPAVFCFTLQVDEEVVDGRVHNVVEFHLPDDNGEIEEDTIMSFGDAVLDKDPLQMGKCRGPRCECCKHGCTCSRRDRRSNINVTADLMLADADDTSSPKISAKFMIGGPDVLWFEEEFPFDQTDDICKKLKGTEYCFKFEAQLTCSMLKGGVWMSKPDRLNLGCFKFPL